MKYTSLESMTVASGKPLFSAPDFFLTSEFVYIAFLVVIIISAMLSLYDEGVKQYELHWYSMYNGNVVTTQDEWNEAHEKIAHDFQRKILGIGAVAFLFAAIVTMNWSLLH